MRVCFVAPYPPERDGIGDHTASLAAALRERGHDTLVVAARPSAAAPPEVVGSLPTTRRERERLLLALQSRRPEVVHVQFGVAAYGTRLLALLRLLGALQRTPARVVVDLHEVTRDTGLLRGPGRALYRRVVRGCEVVIVHTRAAQAALRESVHASGAPARVIPLPAQEPPPAQVGADELRSRHGLAGKRVLLAFGFIHLDKGLTDLVRGLARLVRCDEPAARRAHLVVAGAVRRRQGAFRAFELPDRLHLLYARALIRGARLNDRVTFTGYVPDGEVRPWFELADCAVLPYRRIDQSAVAQFAAAVGTPVLASGTGGLSELGAEPRLSFPPRRPDRLAAALRSFLSEGSAPAPRGRSLDEFCAELLDCYGTAATTRQGAGVGALG